MTIDNGKPAHNFRTTTPGRLRTLLLEHKDPVLLLGAGASIKSGIPAAGSTVEQLARWAWCKDNGRHPEDPTVRRSDYWPWLQKQIWFKESVNLADLYPAAVDALLGVRSDRREFFDKLINPPVPPSQGYVALADLMHQGWISTVLTTNFDPCLPKAKVLLSRPHRIVEINTPSDYVMFSSAPTDPQLVFLHGSVSHYTDKNITSEVQTLDPPLVECLKPLLRDHPLIVVGYRGTEHSVMNDLLIAQAKAGGFLQGIYWCVLSGNANDPFSSWVHQLADTINGNFQLVPIDGFDELMRRDLLDHLNLAGEAPPKRRSGYSSGDLTADMRPLNGFKYESLEQPLLQARLPQYAQRTGLWVPQAVTATWIDSTSVTLNLTREIDNNRVPTLAGWLLFSSNPSQQFPQARIEFSALGPPGWLRKRLGEDVDLEAGTSSENATVRRTITGNLWNQLDELTDLLAVFNFQFRLKAEVSRQVSAYNAMAIKEVIVNAVVHRDYEREEPVEVILEPASITVRSPGGLVKEVKALVGDRPFEEAIKLRTQAIKGYRNPAISDLFYGGGQMDRAGSGLPDLMQLAANNNSTVRFGPSTDNKFFSAVLTARPEAVDEITNTALQTTEETVRYSSNILQIQGMPERIWHAGTDAKSNRSFYQNAEGLAAPPGHVSSGRFYSLYDLEQMTEVMSTPFAKEDIETLSVRELMQQLEGETILRKLLYDQFFEHLKARGMLVDYGRKRAYFARGEEPELKISYQARVRKATRTVVKARNKRDSTEVLYYEHKALSFSIMNFGNEWGLILNPGYAFTRDGGKNALAPDRITVLSTRRAAHDFNPNVLQDVTFWSAIISGEADGLFALRLVQDSPFELFAPTVLMSHRPPTISYNEGMFSEGESVLGDNDDLGDLDAELEALAEMPPDESDAASEVSSDDD